MVAAGGALMAWAFAAHYRAAPRGWVLETRLTPGYLLRRGPYRLSRNPMYAGEAAVWLGWALFYGSPVVWAGLAIVSAAFTQVVRWEERRLLERFGEDYRAYLVEVPRWMPRDVRRGKARRWPPQRGLDRLGLDLGEACAGACNLCGLGWPGGRVVFYATFALTVVCH